MVDDDSGRGCVCVRAGRIQELYFLLDFAVNIKLPLKIRHCFSENEIWGSEPYPWEQGRTLGKNVLIFWI